MKLDSDVDELHDRTMRYRTQEGLLCSNIAGKNLTDVIGGVPHYKLNRAP